MHKQLIHTKLTEWFGNTDVSQILAYTLDLLYEANVPIYSDEDDNGLDIQDLLDSPSGGLFCRDI